jgi:ABC transporter substrate binding protein
MASACVVKDRGLVSSLTLSRDIACQAPGKSRPRPRASLRAGLAHPPPDGRYQTIADISGSWRELSAPQPLGLDVVTLEARQTEDIAPAFEAHKGDMDALYVCAGPLVNTNVRRINALALAARLPTIHGEKEYVEVDGLMSYGPNVSDLFRRAAEYVDKILRGAKPADLPVEQPTKYEPRE